MALSYIRENKNTRIVKIAQTRKLGDHEKIGYTYSKSDDRQFGRTLAVSQDEEKQVRPVPVFYVVINQGRGV